jgi:hypothetical protein
LYFSSAASPSPAQGHTGHKSTSAAAPPPPLPRSPPSVGITNTKAAEDPSKQTGAKTLAASNPAARPSHRGLGPESITRPSVVERRRSLTRGWIGWSSWCSPLLCGCLCTEGHRRILENQPSVARPSCNPQRHPPSRLKPTLSRTPSRPCTGPTLFKSAPPQPVRSSCAGLTVCVRKQTAQTAASGCGKGEGDLVRDPPSHSFR